MNRKTKKQISAPLRSYDASVHFQGQASSSSRGFTLIELLIVIVIIAILAGLVLGVLNPIQQQNRARDATVNSSITKAALSNKSLYVSSPRIAERIPTLNEFINGIGNEASETCAASASADLTGAAASCTFTLQGITAPATCDSANLYNRLAPGDSTACQFLYYRHDGAGVPVGSTPLFRIAALGAARPQQLFVYEMVERVIAGDVSERFLSCPENTDVTVATLPVTCVTLN